MADLILYGLPHSNFVRACAMTALEKGASYDQELTGFRDMRSRELLAVAPFGKVPAMRHGEVVLFESLAIMRYIDLTFGPPDALQPADPLERIRMDQWFTAVMGAIDRHVVRDWALEYMFPTGPDRQPDEKKIARSRKAVARDLAILEEALADSGHLAGGSLSLADIVLVCTLDVLGRVDGGEDLLAAAPGVAAAMDALRARDSWQKACAGKITPQPGA